MANFSAFYDTVLIPGPSFHIDLAALDARHPIHYSRRLLIFRCASPAQRDTQLAALKIGLKALVSRCPILGGIVASKPEIIASDGEQDWRTILPDRGIELIIKDLRKTMPSFEELEAAEFPPLQFPYDLLVPVPQDIDNERPFAACKIQFSVIEGGTILTSSMSHSVADGGGMNELMRVLAEETRLAPEKPNNGAAKEVRSTSVTTGMGLDRSVLRNLTSKMEFNIEDHPAYCWKTSPPANTPTHPFESTVPEIPVLLHISKASLAQLKLDATLPDAPPISTHDALCGLIWRTVLLIRRRRSASAKQLSPSTISNLFLPSDARRHLNLPQSYIGNAVYQLTAALEIQTLLSPSGLQHAASALRRAITTVKPELVSSLMAMTNERWINWQFEKTWSTTGVAMGTDWTRVYTDDWGKAFGQIIRYRYPGEAFCAVMPKLPNGAAEVMVSVMPEEVELLKSGECFGKYLEVM